MTSIFWDIGTGYDFFISLSVLHHAGDFGLRPSWAAGVRQRLSQPKREFLEKIGSFTLTPLHWIASLPTNKNATDVLQAIANVPAAERLSTLTLTNETSRETRGLLDRIASRGMWNQNDQDFLRQNYRRRDELLKPKALNNLLDCWASPSTCGEMYLASLKEYYQVFFAEEETRITPVLMNGLENAKDISRNLSLDRLIDRLSRGIHIADLGQVAEITLVPSYWSTPLVFIARPEPGKMLLLFGVRPEGESIVHGTDVPDLLVNTLKSLADPTRLRILRYLAREPLTPSGLAQRLRLRPPTVIHHLQSLRLAGLVQITISENNERAYAARLDALDEINLALRDFILKE